MKLLPLALLVAALSVVPIAAVGCRDRAVPPPPVVIPALEPPLHDAALDEELVTRRGSEEWHYRVVKAGDLEVVVEVVTYVEGVPQDRPQRFQWHRNGFGLPPNAVIRKIEPGRIEFDGERRPCWILHVSVPSSGQFYYWISSEVGVHGILKISRSESGAPDETHAITRVSDSLSGK